ncbi:DUF2971 domain-containing protein [Agrobacterium sp. ST15.16.055]|nr:DUF2971 domain-containing protein [Agrobacterium sp. ST15.16.055]
MLYLHPTKSRIFWGKPLTLYHYCSLSTFESIIRTKSIWLSSLSSSNDTQEGRWTDSLLRKVCLEYGYTSFEIERLSELFKTSLDFWDVLGLCLTPDDDMLSQWRGYADDGFGFAIGFNDDSLASCAAANTLKLQQVAYSEAEQLEIFRTRFFPEKEAIRDVISKIPVATSTGWQGAQDQFRAVISSPAAVVGAFMLALIDLSYRMKNPAFREENETRLTRAVPQNYAECEFHTSGKKLVPHYAIHFSSTTPSMSIDRIVLGPRNPTPLDVAKAFLSKYGFTTTDVSRSSASYRGVI